jgi:hypothetical protein
VSENTSGSPSRVKLRTLRHNSRRHFLAGVLCGAIFTAVVGAALLWWERPPKPALPTVEQLFGPPPRFDARDNAIYDNCLMASGNTVSCDAMMRVLERERTAEAAMKTEATKLLAAGFSKREVVKWAMDKGFVGSQLSDAVGISLQDLQAGKY